MKKIAPVIIIMLFLTSVAEASRLLYTSELVERADVIGMWLKEDILIQSDSIELEQPQILYKGNWQIHKENYRYMERLKEAMKTIVEEKAIPKGLIMFITIDEKDKIFDLVGDLGFLSYDRIHGKVVEETINQIELVKQWDSLTLGERLNHSDIIISGNMTEGEEYPRQFYILIDRVYKGIYKEDTMEILPPFKKPMNEKSLFFIQRYYGTGPNYMLIGTTKIDEATQYLNILK